MTCPAYEITMYRGRGARRAYGRASFWEGVLHFGTGVTADGESVKLARSATPLHRRREDRSGEIASAPKVRDSSAQANGLGTEHDEDLRPEGA